MYFGMDAGKCPSCGSSKLIYNYGRGEIFCAVCGSIVTQNIVDLRQEWRAFDASQREKRSRTRAPETILRHDKGLSTDIGSGRNVSGLIREKMYRLKKWQSCLRVSNAAERDLAFALTELDRIASQLNIRGISIESVIAACRLLKIPRTLDGIADIARVDKKEIGRSFRFIARNLNLTPKKLFVKPTDYEVVKVLPDLLLPHCTLLPFLRVRRGLREKLQRLRRLLK